MVAFKPDRYDASIGQSNFMFIHFIIIIFFFLEQKSF